MKSLILTTVAAMALVVAGCEDSAYNEQADVVRDQSQMDADRVRQDAQQDAIEQRRSADVTADNLRSTDPQYNDNQYNDNLLSAQPESDANADADAVEEIGDIRAEKIEEEAEVKADLIEQQGEAQADRIESLD